jgi:hypothetical protein
MDGVIGYEAYKDNKHIFLCWLFEETPTSFFPLSWATKTGKCVGRHIFINHMLKQEEKYEEIIC